MTDGGSPGFWSETRTSSRRTHASPRLAVHMTFFAVFLFHGPTSSPNRWFAGTVPIFREQTIPFNSYRSVDRTSPVPQHDCEDRCWCIVCPLPSADCIREVHQYASLIHLAHIETPRNPKRSVVLALHRCRLVLVESLAFWRLECYGLAPLRRIGASAGLRIRSNTCVQSSCIPMEWHIRGRKHL